jgi:hypothetical protein
MMTHNSDRDHEPHHAASSTALLLTELQLFGHRPFQDEPDNRPLPAPDQVSTALADIFDGLVAPSPTRVSNPTSRICSGPPSTCSSASATGSSANSTATSRRSVGARRSRTVPKSIHYVTNLSFCTSFRRRPPHHPSVVGDRRRPYHQAALLREAVGSQDQVGDAGLEPASYASQFGTGRFLLRKNSGLNNLL